MVSIRQSASNNCGTPLLERRYPAFRNGGFTAQEYSQNLSDTSYSPDMRIKSYKQKQKRLSDDEVGQIVKKYNAGASTYELAAEFGCHRSTISRTLKKAGMVVSHKASKREGLVERVIELYDGFMRPVDIGKELGISESTVRRILHTNGVRIRHSSEYSKSHDVR